MRYFVILLALLLALPAAAAELIATEATFVWDAPGVNWPQPPNPDTPQGYRVYVSRNAGDYNQEQEVTDATATIPGAVGETISVKVSAYVGTAVSALSEPSEPVTFSTLPPPGGVVIFGVREVAPGVYVPE